MQSKTHIEKTLSNSLSDKTSKYFPLFRVTKKGNSIYLLGSLHALEYFKACPKPIQKIIENCTSLTWEGGLMELNFNDPYYKREPSAEDWYEKLKNDTNTIRHIHSTINNVVKYFTHILYPNNFKMHSLIFGNYR